MGRNNSSLAHRDSSLAHKDTSHVNSVENIDLKTKKDFQLRWEDRHHNGLTEDVSSVLELTKNIGIRQITKIYDFDKDKDIGSGHYGIVRKARLKVEPAKTFAIKSVDKAKLKGNISLLTNELELMRSTDHPNIIQFYEIF